MDQLLQKVQQKVQDIADHHSSSRDTSGGGTSAGGKKGLLEGLPEIVLKSIDKYVDGLAPEISPIISKEISNFQTATVDSLEAHLKEAIHAVFSGNFSAFKKVNNVDQLAVSHQRAADTDSGPIAEVPDAYGQRGLPFAPSLPGYGVNPSGGQERSLPTSQANFSAQTYGTDMGATGEREVARKEHTIFQEALGLVSQFAKAQATDPDVKNKLGGEMGQFIGTMASKIDEFKEDPEMKARQVIPELKIVVTELLTQHHAPLAEQMTTAALGQIKKWLGGHTSARDLGDGLKDDVGGLISGFLHKSSISLPKPAAAAPEEASRSLGDDLNNTAAPTGSYSPSPSRSPSPARGSAPHGVAGILSKKLSKGLTDIRTSTRGDFRSFLSAIEQALFNALPESIKGPLAKIFGGNPFDSSAPTNTNTSRGLGSKSNDLFHEIGDKIKSIIERLQRGLRDRILEVVGGGHRHLEDVAWRMVQNTVVLRVRKYVPGVRVDIEGEAPAVAGTGSQQRPPQQQQQQHQAPPSQQRPPQQQTPTSYPAPAPDVPSASYNQSQTLPVVQGYVYTPPAPNQSAPPASYRDNQPTSSTQGYSSNPPY